MQPFRSFRQHEENAERLGSMIRSPGLLKPVVQPARAKQREVRNDHRMHYRNGPTYILSSHSSQKFVETSESVPYFE